MILSRKHLGLLVALVSAAALSVAYTSQYVFGLKPCILCLYQRVPYAINIALGLLAFAASFRFPRLTALLLWLSVISFFVDAGIAGFHAGVEYKWWPGLDECGGDIVPQNVSIEELRASLSGQEIVRCDEAAWTMFGISMAGYNFFAALFLGCVTAYALRKKNGA